MANIADLIANRNQELEDFKQKKQEERTEAYERRDAAVMEVTSDPEKYRAFLDLHAQTMYNAANTATVWKQRPGATQLLPRKKWAELGRKIREDETPVQVFMRDTRSGYIKLDYVYDKAQTVGDPVPVRGILRDGTPDMEKALGALLAVPAFAEGGASGPLDTINNLSDLVFQCVRAVGVIVAGYGIVQIGLAVQSHDSSQRANGFLAFFGGLLIMFAKEILDFIAV